MTDKEKKDLKRVWGRGKPYKDLLAADLSIERLAALQAAYKAHDLHGPPWAQGWRMWCVAQYKSDGPNAMTETYYKVGSIDMLLCVEAIATDQHWDNEQTLSIMDAASPGQPQGKIQV